jgi:hypothetical protein
MVAYKVLSVTVIDLESLERRVPNKAPHAPNRGRMQPVRAVLEKVKRVRHPHEERLHFI